MPAPLPDTSPAIGDRSSSRGCGGGPARVPRGRPGPPTGDVSRTGITIADIPDAVFATDLENRITDWADSAADLFGYTATEAIGRSFGDLLPFRMRDAADDADIVDAIRAGRTWRGEGTVRLRDGTERWIESTVKPRIVHGTIVGSVSVSRDMTATIEAELRLSDEKRFIDAIIDGAGTLVIVVDTEGRVVRFNGACERLSGYQEADFQGHMAWDRLLPPDQLDDAVAALTDLQAGAFPSHHENDWICRDGERRRISWYTTCLTDNAGAVTHVIGAGMDVTEQRRADDALAGIAAIGQVLAVDGPADTSLDAVLGILADHMAYRYMGLVLAQGDRLRVGAARGYADLPASLPITDGIVGRVYRTGAAEWIRDVALDPDYREFEASVRSEIAAPLQADGQTIGVLDIEAAADVPLSERDFRLAQTVAERVASALLLGREQRALAQRARLFAALSEFGQAANAILDPERLLPALMTALKQIFPGDVMTLTTLDRSTGQYRLSAAYGVDPSTIGLEVRLGDGPAGRAIEQRAFIGPVELHRPDYADALRDVIPLDALISVTVPLIRDDLVLGAISVGRANLDHPFSEVECEVMQLLGSQAALALANAQLHEEVLELSIHDGLTGLYNRRHFDASLDLLLARSRRLGAGAGLAAIMFDLDNFGRFNKEYGHQAGDAVLRAFAGILRERLRSSDLVARYGGEEFVVILEDCSLAGAVRVAEEVRSALETRVIDGPDRQRLGARVSAGCAVLNPAEATRETLLRTADVGLFMAKRAGRNQVVAA